MVKVWFVMVLLIVKNVIANDEDPSSMNCDMCIRSGKSWCHSNTKQSYCFDYVRDDSCPGNNVEKLPFKHRTPQTNDEPKFYETTLYLADGSSLPLQVNYTSENNEKKNVIISFLNTTDPKIDVNKDEYTETVCTPKGSKYECKLVILAIPHSDFCSSEREFVDVQLKFNGSSSEVIIRYNVVCSCVCSKLVLTNAKECNFRGNYSCGVCNCESEWTGDTCETKYDECSRGDIVQNECLTERGEEVVDCYGNGKCVCNKCICSKYGLGSKYFDESEMCADVCLQTMECDTCLRNGTLGPCNCHKRYITLLELNETMVATAKDEMNRKDWVQCKEYTNGCDIDYYAMKSEDGYFVMMKNNCSSLIAEKNTETGSKVPLIFGILALLAVIAAVAGVLLWKHMSATDPSVSAQQAGLCENIDAENCTGVNPLYKNPVSSYKNPNYKKL